MPRLKKTAEPIDRALARLAKARKRLDGEQGIVARHNARQEVLGAMREVRRVLDRDYPVIQKKRKPRRRQARVKDGYVRLSDHVAEWSREKWLRAIATAKIGIQDIKRKPINGRGPGVYVPHWVLAVGNRYNLSVAKLKQAKKSRVWRETELTAWLLSQDQP